MNRRDFLKNSTIAISSISALGMASKKKQQLKDKPNILFIFSDQQRHDTIDCYGSPIFEGLTPNLNKMAAEGVRFQYAFTPQPVCGPARACIQTSKYATEIGCYRNGISLPQDKKTIAHYMSQAGYEVGYIGKWHLASDIGLKDESKDINYCTKAIPVARRGGYKDYWLAADVLEFTSTAYGGHMFDINNQRRDFPEGRYRVDAQTDWAIEYLNSRTCEKPFFLFLSYIEPHHQNDAGHFLGPKGSKEKFKNYNIPGDLKGKQGDWQNEMPDYLGCCHSLDENVGRLRAELDNLGITDNTLVIYTTDHSCHFYTRGKREEYKRTCHDNAIRIPMIIYGPGFKGGQVINDFVSLLDTAPTILTAGGVKKMTETYRGKPLQKVVNNTSNWRQDVFIQISESRLGRAVRTKSWTYGVNAPHKDALHDSKSEIYIEEFLYDNDKDPYQRNNLVSHPKYKQIREKRHHANATPRIDSGNSPAPWNPPLQEF